MTFDEVLADIEKLTGKKLQSIKPGAEITIEKFDKKNQRITLKTSRGKIMPRPFTHLHKVWEALVKQPAVFVEDVLKGSGPSRNQPETILANLPYIEWLKLDNKKHITLVEKPTHLLGTLKQMDAIEVESLKHRMEKDPANLGLPTAVIIAGDIGQAARNIENATGLTVTSLEAGIYMHVSNGIKILLVTSNMLQSNVATGTYLVVPNGTVPFLESSTVICVAGHNFRVLSRGDVNLFISVDLAE